jgi:hypothetical protein
MRVGVYVDGFNLYYGGRDSCGKGTAGWRWLDIRSLAEDLIGRRRNWEGAFVERLVYCTARISATSNRDGAEEQDIYLKALRAGNIVDLIEYGHYVARVKTAPLATENKSGKPVLTRRKARVGIGGRTCKRQTFVRTSFPIPAGIIQSRRPGKSCADGVYSGSRPPGPSWAGFSFSEEATNPAFEWFVGFGAEDISCKPVGRIAMPTRLAGMSRHHHR